MPHKPKVSVVIPTYNRPEMLARAIRSVNNQSYSDIELIVVDGPSEIPASEVLHSHDLSVDYECVSHETLQGLPGARNTGIEVARGEYVAFLDDDDEWKKEKIRKQVNRVQSGDFGAVYSGVEQISEDGTTNAVKKSSKEGDVLPNLFSRNFIGTPSCLMVKSGVASSIDGFDENMRTWEDWDFYIRIAEKWSFASVPEPLVKRHHHGDQMATDVEEKEEIAPYLFEKHKHLTHNYENWDEKKFKAGIEFYLAESAFVNDMFSKARNHLLNAIQNNPSNPKYYFYLSLVSGGKYTFYPVQRLKRKVVNYTSK